jgi:hypothetical protein
MNVFGLYETEADLFYADECITVSYQVSNKIIVIGFAKHSQPETLKYLSGSKAL